MIADNWNPPEKKSRALSVAQRAYLVPVCVLIAGFVGVAVSPQYSLASSIAAGVVLGAAICHALNFLLGVSRP